MDIEISFVYKNISQRRLVIHRLLRHENGKITKIIRDNNTKGIDRVISQLDILNIKKDSCLIKNNVYICSSLQRNAKIIFTIREEKLFHIQLCC